MATASTTPTDLYSMARVSRLTGVNRQFLHGLVKGGGIPTYAGPGGAVAIDGAGLERVRRLIARHAARPAVIL